MGKQNNRFLVQYLLSALCIIAFCMTPTLAFSDQSENGKKPIDLEFIYKKDDLGLKQVDPNFPHSLQWSKQGHWLAYLVSSTTEAPHLVVYDPAQDATKYCVTPYTMNDALIKLASQPEGIAIDSAEQVAYIPEDATEGIKKINSFSWMQEEPTIQLDVEGDKYEWNIEENCLKKADEKKELPSGVKNDLEYSPNERYAAYTRDNNIFVYDTEQRKEFQLTDDGSVSILNGKMTWVYWEELHYRRSYRAFYWAPDSQSIAYLQFNEKGVSTYPVTDFSDAVPKTRNMFYPKVGTQNPLIRLGVVSLSTRQTKWIDLGEPYEYIARVTWHPNGETLAVQTLNRAQTKLTLLYSDPVTCTSKIILEETDKVWVNAHGGPYFLEKKDEFLWLSERSGYRHIYKYSNDGKKCKQLTKGDWEANPTLWTISIPIDEEKGLLYFTASMLNPIERHLYSVPLRGGKIKQLTKEAGVHRVTFSEDKKYAFKYFSDVNTPNRVQVINNKGKVIHTLGETLRSDYDPYITQIPEIIEMEGPEGRTFYGSILKPYNFDHSKKYPVILHMYAGPAAQVVMNQFVSQTDLAMCNRGFIVFRFDTRGTTGRGREWINAIHLNGCDLPLEDLKFAAEYIKKLPYVNPEKLGIWGWSNGGYMTCCAMLKIPGTFQAGAAVAPLTDHKLYDTVYTERFMGMPEDNPDGYKESAPTNFADGLEGSLLLAHGVSDDNVHIQNIYHLVNALLEAEKDYELYLYPERDHGIGGDDRRYHLFSRILDFFERKLMDE